MLPSFLARDHTVAGPGFSLWLILPPALSVHPCIGQVYVRTAADLFAG